MFQLPNHKIKMYEKSLTHIVIIYYNHLPEDVKYKQDFIKFKKAIYVKL